MVVVLVISVVTLRSGGQGQTCVRLDDGDNCVGDRDGDDLDHDHHGGDTEDMYFRLGFSHRFTSPILLYIIGKMTGIDSSCSDMHRTPKE